MEEKQDSIPAIADDSDFPNAGDGFCISFVSLESKFVKSKMDLGQV